MKARAFTILAAIAIMTWASQAKATFTVFDEMVETMMEAQAEDSLFIGHIFGPDGSTTLNFTSALDPITGNFSYSTLPGQFYLDQSISLSTLGTYDPLLRQAEWTMSGQLGAENWSGDGSAIWTGDPTVKVNTTITVGGVVYQVTGDVEYDGSGPHSTGKYSFISPPDGPFGARTFGPYDGKDTFLDGKWVHEVTVPTVRDPPITPDGLVIFSAGQIPFPDGGVGNFNVRIASIPEPPTLLLFGMGAIAGLVYFHRRRKHSA